MTSRSRPISRLRAMLWLLTFLAHPVGGLVTRLTVGSVDGAFAALLGGLILGVAVGVAQAIALRSTLRAGRWIVASVCAGGVGVLLANVLTNYETGISDLVLKGALAGCVVGSAQALTHTLSARVRIIWAATTTVTWAGAWVISAAVIVDEDYGYVTFGSTGALVAAMCALPAVYSICRQLHVSKRGE